MKTISLSYQMKPVISKLLVSLLLISCSSYSFSQKINVPLNDAKHELWRLVPTEMTGDATFDDNIHCKEGTDVLCCNCALQKVRAGTNKIAFDEGIKAGINAASEVGKLLLKIGPYGKTTKLVFDLLSAALKGYMAESPEEMQKVLEKEAIKQLGKQTWDGLDDAVKNALNEAVKQVLDKLFQDLSTNDVNKEIGCYKMHIHFTKASDNSFKMFFEASGKCNCEKCPSSHDFKKLNDFKVVGTMTATMTDIKPVERGALFWKKTEYDVTLKWDKPEFWIEATCDCPLAYNNQSQTNKDSSEDLTPCYRFSANALVAYNVPVAGGLLELDNNNGNQSGVYGSWGQGVTFGGSFGYQVYNMISAQLGVSYLSGTTINSTQTTSGDGFSSSESYEGKLNMINLSLGGRANIIPKSNCNTGFIPFVGFGVNLGVGAKIKMTETNSESTGDVSNNSVIHSELSMKTAFGVYGEAGAKYNINSHWSVFGAVRFNTMSVTPHKWVLNSETFNGQDITGSLTVSQKETDYSKTLSSDANSNSNEPYQAIAQPLPASSFSIGAGFIFNFR